MILSIFIAGAIAWAVTWNVLVALKHRRGVGEYDVGHVGATMMPLATGLVLSLFLAVFANTNPSLRDPSLDEPASVVELRALNTGSEISGSFFLGSGSVDEERMIFFVAQTDSYAYLDERRADRSRVIEHDGAPQMVTVATWVDNWIIAPFPIRSRDRFDFYVPPGSVLEQFGVSP